MTREEVLEIIRKTKRKKVATLDLSEGDISELPPEIGKLTALQSLTVSGLNELPREIGQLRSLTRLNLSSNYLRKLPRELFQLRKLSVLNLSSNYLSELPGEIAGLRNLTGLDLNSNQLAKIPKALFQLRKLSVLDLSSNYLTELPGDIGLFRNLIRLDSSSNHLGSLPREIGRLRSLEVLDLSFNRLENLPPEITLLRNLTVLYLNSNHLRELPRGVTLLRSLSQLYLNFNQLNRLPREIAQLGNLSILSLNSNHLGKLPEGIAMLRNLRELYLGNNQIARLPKKITRLRGLSILDLSSNCLTELPSEIGRLSELAVLYLDSNELSRLPREIARLDKLEHLDVNKNPLAFPPMEIAAQGAPAIRDYLKNSGRGGQTLYEGKILIVGQGGVGKTCLLRRLTINKFSEDQVSTEGIDIHLWKITAPNELKTEMTLNVWDFGGQEIYHATHQFFLTQRSLYLLVWDARQEEEYGRIDYWLKTIQSFAEDSPVLIVMNKADERNKDLNFRELKENYSQIISSRKVSARNGAGIEELRKFIGKEAWRLPLMGTFWPSSWLAIRRTLRSTPRYHLPYKNYLTVCEKNHVDKHEAKTLSQYLHDLGIILHFQNDPLLMETLILKPAWGTDAVYKVLDSKVVRKRNGILYSGDLPKIWKNRTMYPQDKYPTILRLMANFELAFPFGKGERYVVAEFLPTNEPEYEWNPVKPVQFEYHYEFLPAGLMTRLIVRMHKYLIEHEGVKLCWREGAYLEDNDSQAVVRLVPGSKVALIQADGPAKREFLAVIREHFKAIHQTIRKIRFREKIPCTCVSSCNHSFDYNFLLRCEERGIRDVICEKNADYVRVGKLLDGIEKAKLRQKKVPSPDITEPPSPDFRIRSFIVLTVILIILSIIIWTGDSDIYIFLKDLIFRELGIGN